MRGWLTTVVARVCLDMLRSRNARPEEPLGAHVPDRSRAGRRAATPSTRRCWPTRSVSLLVVLQTPAPAERVAFVLHDRFDLPFDEIAPIVGRSLFAELELKVLDE